MWVYNEDRKRRRELSRGCVRGCKSTLLKYNFYFSTCALSLSGSVCPVRDVSRAVKLTAGRGASLRFLSHSPLWQRHRHSTPPWVRRRKVLGKRAKEEPPVNPASLLAAIPRLTCFPSKSRAEEWLPASRWASCDAERTEGARQLG